MSLELYAIGEYKGTKILLRKGTCLKEFPFYYVDDYSSPIICNYALYSSIYQGLELDVGLAGEIMKLEESNLAEKIAERGTKRPKIGELIFVPTYLTHWESIIFVVIDELQNPTDDDRIDITEYIRNGYDIAENKNYSAIVTPGHPVVFQMFPIDVSADIHFEAIEMFLDNRETSNIKIISICIESEEQIQAFLKSGLEKFKKYSSWLFLKQPS